LKRTAAAFTGLQPSRAGYFIDSRFVTGSADRPPARERRLPPRKTIIANLLAAQGSAYVWGGNLHSGLPEMRTFFPPRLPPPLPPRSAARWDLRGLDCSGLLYEATGGFTPRNTSLLTGFGRAVPCAGLTGAEIVKQLEPLDLIVWNGHVLIVLDRDRLIESRLDCSGERDGVRVRPLPARLQEIMQTRKPLDSYGEAGGGGNGFVIRRWYGPPDR
jgi:cell wall-associated NlpC family hydrolase